MRRRDEDKPVSDINITPLTDVMLVLLVIFMISSPVLMAKGVEVHLPQVTDPPALVEEDHVLFVAEDGSITLDGTTYTVKDLYEQLINLVGTADETGDVVNLFIHADSTVTYGDITSLMDLATNAGIEKISLVQEMLDLSVLETPDLPEDATPE